MLASVVLVSLNNARAKARDAIRKSDLTQVSKALELYYNVNGSYPNTGGGWWGETSAWGSHPLTGATGYIPGLAPSFIIKLPHDANTGKPYGGGVCNTSTTWPTYLYNSNGTDYKFIAHCLPESFPENDPFIDPTRSYWAWGIWTAGAVSW